MPIQTLVFFDLETTGIPASTAKVTEITLISVSRNDIEQADGKDLPPVHKLSILCNPQKDIQPAAAKLTGLTNKFLKNQPAFKDIIKCINSFLDKPKPVCLVAHNGNRFDFKILQAEYLSANENLPHDLLCVDSLNVFRNILKESYNSKSVHDDTASSLDESDRIVHSENNWQELSKEEIQEIDELVDQFSQLTSTPNVKKIKKEPNVTTPKENKAPKVSYSLSSIYDRLFNKEIKGAHRAEADCMMLLECVVAMKKDFLAYADSKQKLISQINI